MTQKVEVYRVLDQPQRPCLRTQNALVTFSNVKPGQKEAAHNHPFDKIVVVLKGTMVMEVDGAQYDLPAGSAIVIPALAKHTGWSKTGEMVHHIGIFAPVRKDYLSRTLNQKDFDDFGAEWIHEDTKTWT